MSFRFAPEGEDRPVRVLVVGGSTQLTETLTPLRVGGEAVSVARVGTVAAAVNFLHADAEVGVVVSATTLPDGTGQDLLARVHEIDLDRPVILVGDAVSATEERDALTAGATDVVRFSGEPTDGALLRARVGRLLNPRSAGAARPGRLMDMVLRVEQAITSADNRGDLEAGVCTELVATEGFPFAWIGSVESHPRRVTPQAQAGREQGYLDTLDLTLGDSLEPAAKTADSRTRTIETELSAAAQARGFRSVLSLPLVHEGRLYGVLSVYADVSDAFDEFTEQVVVTLAAGAARGIAAFERRRALLADTVTELTLKLPADTGLFGRLAGAVDATVTLDGVIPRGESLLVFLSTDEGATALESALAEESVVAGVTAGRRNGTAHYEVVLDGPSLIARLVDQGGTLRRLVADPDGTRLVVSLPTDTDVRVVIDTLRESYPALTLISRTQQDSVTGSVGQFRTTFEERVTDRQLQALRTAFLSGYFEWPREHTAEEVASLLDITQPTLNRHLRVAERRLLALLFDEG